MPQQKVTAKEAEVRFLKEGDLAPDFELADATGAKHRLSALRGSKIVLSFHRFAACPPCLYNIDRMKEQYKMLNRAGIVTLCVFRSPPSHIANYAASVHDHNLLTLSDEKGSVYKAYMVGKSASGFLRDAAKMIKNLPKYKKFVHPGGMAKGATKVTQLPADFLIDENGMIKRVVMGGLMTFEQLEEFIPKEKRCKCNKQDCISRTCREQYEQIRSESAAMFGGA